MIQCEHVSFSYKRERAVRDCSFSLPAGSLCGLLGRNAAGKTTLIKLLAGLLLPQSGQIEVVGRSPRTRSADFYASIACVPQDLPAPRMSVQKYADICGDLYPDFSFARFGELCRRFFVDPGDQFGTLSGGDLRKAWLSFALACNTPVLLLDEPLQGLDIPAQETLRQVLAETGAEGRSILLATHHVREIENLIDSLVLMHTSGQIVCAGDLESVYNRFTMLNTTAESDIPTDCIYSRRTPTGWEGIIEQRPPKPQSIPLELLFHALAGPGGNNAEQ